MWEEPSANHMKGGKRWRPLGTAGQGSEGADPSPRPSPPLVWTRRAGWEKGVGASLQVPGVHKGRGGDRPHSRRDSREPGAVVPHPTSQTLLDRRLRELSGATLLPLRMRLKKKVRDLTSRLIPYLIEKINAHLYHHQPEMKKMCTEVPPTPSTKRLSDCKRINSNVRKTLALFSKR